MKFNVGDRVIDLSNLLYLDNCVWNKDKITDGAMVKVVIAANEKFFSVYEKSIPEDMFLVAGMNGFKYFYQDTGKSYCSHSNTQLFHLIKDTDKINSIVNERVESVSAAIKQKNNANIEILKRNINQIESGDTTSNKALIWSIESLRKLIESPEVINE